MRPPEREYVVGPTGFRARSGRRIIRYGPGERVWLSAPPPGADLHPTGATRPYETKAPCPTDRR
jgi:hypothetical protein